jgi:hypothetical protein
MVNFLFANENATHDMINLYLATQNDHRGLLNIVSCVLLATSGTSRYHVLVLIQTYRNARTIGAFPVSRLSVDGLAAMTKKMMKLGPLMSSYRSSACYPFPSFQIVLRHAEWIDTDYPDPMVVLHVSRGSSFYLVSSLQLLSQILLRSA